MGNYTLFIIACILVFIGTVGFFRTAASAMSNGLNGLRFKDFPTKGKLFLVLVIIGWALFAVWCVMNYMSFLPELINSKG